MILERSAILGFGKLGNRTIDFQSGLNLIFAPNEGGKSTLQRFLVGLLYGQLRSDLRIQRRLDPWVEQYKPWRGKEYGGILWCRLADGGKLEIHRSFGREETRIEIRSSTGEDITSRYEQQRNGEVLFARFHFGLSKELFESLGVIRENKVAEIRGCETIRDRIANLAHSGDEDLSIRHSLSVLRDGLDSLGSERAPTKPYRQAMDLLQALRSERTAADERRIQCSHWIEERNRLAAEIAQSERELAETQTVLLSARMREIAARVGSLEEIESVLCSIRTEMETLESPAEFPAERLEELNRLVGARDSLSGRLSEARSDEEAALAQLNQVESEHRKLSAYEAYSGDGGDNDGERITEWFVSYLSLSLQKDGVQKALIRSQVEARALEKNLGSLSPVFMDPDIDWQRMAREAAEEEQAASLNCESLSGQLIQQKAAVASWMRAALNRRVLAVVFLALGAIPSMLRILGGLHPFPFLYEIGFASLFAAAAAFMFYFASKSATAGRNAKHTLNGLETESKRIREEGGIKRQKLNEVIADSGFEGLDGFLAAAKQSERDRQKLSDLQTRQAEAEQQRTRLQVQLDEIFQSLKEGLGKVGLVCAPGNLKFQIDLFRSSLRRFRELDSQRTAWMQKVHSLKSKRSVLVTESEENGRQIQSLLNQAGVETPEDFREKCSRRQKLLELLEKEASHKREFERLAGDQTLDQWKQRLKELTEQQIPAHTEPESAAEFRMENSKSSERCLPYLPSLEEAEEELKRIGSRLSGAREEHARCVERIRHAFENVRPSFEIDEDLAVAERRFQELERNRLALDIALETLEKLSRQQQEVLAPQLNLAVEQRFLRLCGRRYEEVKIDPDFQVWVREGDTGELRPVESLSRGTQDQLYFAIRFGVLDLISNEAEPCPGLLDEPFAAYDRSRLGEAFEVLSEESGRRQILLFTCREDLFDPAQKCGANIIRLENPQEPQPLRSF